MTHKIQSNLIKSIQRQDGGRLNGSHTNLLENRSGIITKLWRNHQEQTTEH